MKKIILIITICSVLAITLFYFYNAKNSYNLLNKETNKINNSIKKKNKTNYSFKRWDDGFYRFYTDSMLKKYPEILQYDQFMLRNHFESPFIIKRDNDDLYGVYDKETNKLLIPHKYEMLESCSSSYSMFFIGTEKNKFLDKKKLKQIIAYNNDIVFESNYDEYDCSTFYCGIRTNNNGKYGVVSYDGIEVVKPEYDEIICQEHFGESGGWYYIVRKDDKYGVFDNHGNKIIPLQNKKLGNITGSPFFIIYDNGKKGVINIYGEIIIPPKYNSIELKSFGYKLEDYYFVTCNENNTCYISDIYGEIEHMVEGANSTRAIIKLEKGYYIKNCEMDIYGEIEHILEGVNSTQAIRKLEKGYQTKNCEMDTSVIYDNNGKKVADVNGIIIAPLSDKYIFYRTFGVDGGLGVIDYKGQVIMEPKFDAHDISGVSKNGLINIMRYGKNGIVYNNKMLLEPVYHNVYLSFGHVLVLNIEDGEKYYYIASDEDFVKFNGDLSKCKKYHIRQFRSLKENRCYKFIKDDGTEDLYCDSN